ncbi:ribosome maturation factor RimP [Pseudochryseolinea flava]|uniref:Ribosome maturation factor RimP n=1 Tax=Pseudochryseolinea flava TaxID=2059302 RepID=A0A364YAB4_9BACT|nr:ribosome maturation factor RimP [Pseudochryseolinea flava]RAW03102.1 ribosome maturation factor RimP [Pseudochryseolinea flava]
MDLLDQIKSIAASKLTDPSHFLVDVILSARKGPKKLLIVIDGDQGVTIDDCGNISRDIAKVLDESDLMADENYLLEVSTPGVDHPLKFPRQYKKHIGRRLKVKLTDKTIEGKLIDVKDNSITIGQEVGAGKKIEVTNLDLTFSEIEKAFVLVSFK